MSDDVRFKDFTKKRKPVFFTVEGERFDCYPAIALPSLQEIVEVSRDFSTEKAVESFAAFFAVVMDEGNAARMEVLLRDKVNPLDQEQAVEIMQWLLEVYGLRPTQPSSESVLGSPTDDAGTPSEAGA